jgi:hypothetical protein
MANLKQTKTKEDLKKLTTAGVQKVYMDLAVDYNHLLDLDYIYCPHCGKWKASSAFYSSNESKSGIEHFACKECILDMCTDFDADGNRIDNREKTIKVFRRLDWYYRDKDFDTYSQLRQENNGERNRPTAVQQMITLVKSLNHYKGLTFADSEFSTDDVESNPEENAKIVQKTIKAAKKRFGADYTNEELMFLENDYQDWSSRYECTQKAQEETFQSLAILKLMKRNAIKNGSPTKDIDKSYQDWMDTGNLKPKQNALDTLSDSQTLGTLIQKYEETRPLPEIDPELEDVDKIGLYIDAFYRGHASKMLGLKNRFSNIYERVMSKYTVKPPEYDEDADSEALFDKIFGNQEE